MSVLDPPSLMRPAVPSLRTPARAHVARVAGVGCLMLLALVPCRGIAGPVLSKILDHSDDERIVLVNIELDAETEPAAPDTATSPAATARGTPHTLTSSAPPAGPTSRDAPLSDMIRHAALRHGVEPRLLEALVQVESAFNPRAVSPKGAQGLTQLMPQTARALGVQNAFDPRDNLEGGARHLRTLLDRFEQRIDLALAAYNAGEDAVRRHGNTVPPFQETRRYVPRIIALYLGTGGRASAQGVQSGAQRLQGL